MERDGKSYCDRHPNIETSLRCSRCEAHICPKCAVLTTIGYRCPSCGREKSATGSLGPLQLALGSTSGLAFGALLGYYVPQGIGFFLIFAGILAGKAVGWCVRRLIQRKRSVAVGAFTAVGFISGAIFALPVGDAGITARIVSHPWGVLFGVIAGGVAWYELK